MLLHVSSWQMEPLGHGLSDCVSQTEWGFQALWNQCLAMPKLLNVDAVLLHIIPVRACQKLQGLPFQAAHTSDGPQRIFSDQGSVMFLKIFAKITENHGKALLSTGIVMIVQLVTNRFGFFLTHASPRWISIYSHC